MTWWSLSTLSRYKNDLLLTIGTRTTAAISAATVLLVVAFLIRESFPALITIGPWRFVTDDSWYPLSDRFNLLPMMVASFSIASTAVILATPPAILSAVFCVFYAPASIARGYRWLIGLLAGIPSVVFGLWGLVVLAPWVSRLGGSGQCFLTAALVLGLMILPTITLTAEVALRSVPREWMAAAAALGLPRGSIIRRVALPAARRGIGGGLVLAVARAIGETMAVLMLSGNVVQMPDSLLSPVRTLTANIALEMGYATATHRSILFVSGLSLMALVTLAVAVAQWGGHVDEDH